MFTGIVEEKGIVKSIRRGARSALEIEASFAGSLQVGESVAVSGVCLTVTEAHKGAFCADVSPRTLEVTTLGSLKRGDAVNLERAMAFGDRLGGHLVTGHVDGVGVVLRAHRPESALLLTIEAPVEVARYLIERGSVAVDGVSLTAFNVKGLRFEVSIIPHTAAVTTLGTAAPGRRVNLEADMMGKYAERFSRREADGTLTIEKLKELGYA